MSRSLGVGVIGCGVRGQHSYELHLARHPAARIVAVSQYEGISSVLLEGKDAEGHAHEWAAHLGAAYCDSPASLLARDDVDIVSLMVEPRAAADLVVACAAAGKHIVRDKPMCLTLDEADRIVAATEASRVSMLITLGTRYAASLRAARDVVMSGRIGDLIVANFTYLQAGGPLDGFTATREYLERVGGGELTNFGHYALDYLNWLVDSPAETVYALTTSNFYPDYQAVGMEDLGQVAIRYANGVTGTVVTGRTTTFPRPDGYYRVDLTGTGGTVEVSSLGAEITVYSGSRRDLPCEPGIGAVTEMVFDFIDAVLVGRPSPIGPRDGREVLRIIRATYESARVGRPVAVGADGSGSCAQR